MTPRHWADKVVALVDPAVSRDLCTDPLGAIRRHFSRLTVQATPPAWQRAETGLCDGLYIRQSRLILYLPTPGSRRENFTLLHELGHHLIYQDDDLLAWLADHDDPKRAREEVCDQIAARLLVPTELIDRVLDGRKPAATDVASLYEQSAASREVCAVAISRRLGCEGFVALIDASDRRIRLGARTADTRPYAWRDDLLPAGHPLERLAVGGSLCELAWWPFPNGDRRDYWLSAVRDGRFIVAVFADRDLWDTPGLHITDAPPVAGRPTFDVRCSLCGYVGFTSKFPCDVCRKPFCVKCEKCECDRRRANLDQCSRCFASVPRRRLRDGVCNDCAKRPPPRAR